MVPVREHCFVGVKSQRRHCLTICNGLNDDGAGVVLAQDNHPIVLDEKERKKNECKRHARECTATE